MATVSLAMIVKNEQANIADLMNDVCPVLEEVIIVDTGSTDNTLSILEDLQEKYTNLQVHHYTWNENFSDARNYAFSLATQDWVLWLDGDDRIDSEQLAYFKDTFLEDPNTDCWLLPYVYSTFPDGTPFTLLDRERFIRRSLNPQWIGAIHETVNIFNMRQNHYPEMKVIHNRKGKVIDGNRNIRILEKEYSKHPNDTRTAYYYGKELFDSVDPRGVEVLENYLRLRQTRYYDNEVNARARIARAYLVEGRHRDAILMVDPIYHLDSTRNRAEYYWTYGRVEQDLKNYEVAIDWYTRCLKPPPPQPRVLNLEYYTWNPLRRIAECYEGLGNWPKVFEYVKKVEEKLPGDRGIAEWKAKLQSTRLQPKPGHKLITLEWNSNIRHDSFKVGVEYSVNALSDGTESRSRWVIDPRQTPFADNSIDGIVINQTGPVDAEEFNRILKPESFLWMGTTSIPVNNTYFNFLGNVTYQGQSYASYIKRNFNKPSLGYVLSLHTSAHYRYRIHNLMMSAMKAGYPVYPLHCKPEGEVDYFVSLNDFENSFGRVNVLEVCEKLPSYDTKAIDQADVLNASSPLLAEHLRDLYPAKPVINVDDHFELPRDGWL